MMRKYNITHQIIHINTHQTLTKAQKKTKAHRAQVCARNICPSNKANPIHRKTRLAYIIGKTSATSVTSPKNS